MLDIVSLRNKWDFTGLLDNLKTAKQEIELSKYLEKCDIVMTKMYDDVDLPDWFDTNSLESNIPFESIAIIYKSINIIDFKRINPNNINMKLIIDNLRKSEHKINVEEIIELTFIKLKKIPNDGSLFFLEEMANLVAETYIIKYGTLK